MEEGCSELYANKRVLGNIGSGMKVKKLSIRNRKSAVATTLAAPAAVLYATVGGVQSSKQ